MALLDFVRVGALVTRDQCRTPEELAHEGGARSGSTIDQNVDAVDLELEAACIQLDQTSAARCVGKRDFDRLIDPPGARRERGLQEIGAIGVKMNTRRRPPPLAI